MGCSGEQPAKCAAGLARTRIRTENCVSDPPHKELVTNRAHVSARMIGMIVFGSIAWVSVCLGVWAITAVIAGGGFAHVNPLVLGIVLWGAPLGGLASGSTIVAIFLLRPFTTARTTFAAAAILGWSVALAVWLLILGLSEFGLFSAIVAGIAAAIGAAFTAIVSWPRG